MCSPHAPPNQSKNVYVIAGQAQWDVAAKRPKAIWMTHTKSTLLLSLLFLFTHTNARLPVLLETFACEQICNTKPLHPVTPDKMRLIKQNIIEKDGSGTATLLPEEPEDMVSQSVSRRCSANNGR